MNSEYIFTSGSVTEGHPDKLCDTISDAVLDRFLVADPSTRLVAECAVSSGVIFLATRTRSQANLDVAGIVRDIVAEADYQVGEFNASDCTVMLSQAPFLSYALPCFDVDKLDPEEAAKIPASHQTTLFGYANRQTENLMPLPVVLANQLARKLSEMRRAGTLHYLTPDCQVQVAVRFQQNKPVGIESINFLATQKDGDIPTQPQLRDDLMQAVVEPVLACQQTQLHLKQLVVNPDGILVGGGPVAHSGMTGRKISIDTYGDYSRQSGTALSGKDPLRIDRTGAYAARYVAKHVVAAGLADECEVQVSYTVGQSQPISVRVRTNTAGKLTDEDITRRVQRVFDLRPGMIAKRMRLQQLPSEQPRFYQQLAIYGHMGRDDLDVPWEKLDLVESLQAG